MDQTNATFADSSCNEEMQSPMTCPLICEWEDCQESNEVMSPYLNHITISHLALIHRNENDEGLWK